MAKNTFALLAAVLLFLPAFVSAAVSKGMIAPDIYPQPGTSQPQSANAYYKAVFDERGQALTLARFEVYNFGTSSLDEITLQIPGSSVNLKYALQGTQACTQQCAEWRDVCLNYRKVCDAWNDATASCTSWRDECQSTSRQCVRYESKCTSYYYDDYQLTYKLLEVGKVSMNTFTLKLQKPVASGERTVLLLSYRAFGYVNQGLAMDFDFQTIKMPYDLDYTRVAISVDQDLLLKGGETRTDYVQGFDAFEGTLASASRTSDIAGSSLGYAQNIKYAKGYVKEKNNLLANEAFHVTGTYADATWKLYLFDWLFWLAIAAVILYLIAKIALPVIASFLDSMAPKQKASKPQQGEFNGSRVFTTAILSASAFAAFAALYFTVLALVDMFGIFQFHGPAFAIGSMVLLGVLCAILLFLFVNSRYGSVEALVTAVGFIGFSLVMVPVAIMLVYFVFMLFTFRGYSSMMG